MADQPPERWRQRLDEFGRTLDLLTRTDAIRLERPLTEAEEAGLVQFFELAVELGWKTMALWMRTEGVELRNLSPLNVIREAAKIKLIDAADVWSLAVERRNIMAHTYDPDAFRALISDAVDRFLPQLEQLRAKLERIAAS